LPCHSFWGPLTGPQVDASVDLMLATEKFAEQARDNELSESSGSHQQLVALMVESSDLRVEPDPMLEGADWDTLAELESFLYSL
jgi:hypothetical protein